MQYGNEPCGIAALADLVSIKTGKLNSNAAVENGAYPFFTCSRETYKVDTYSFDCEAVLLAGNNANGVYPVKYYKGRFDAYQRTYVIRSVDEGVLNNRYLFYALQLELDLLQSLSTGSATKFLTLTILNALKVRVPSLSDQNRIVSILGAYDDLIENNTRRIEILEEMARRLYEEWFVQFRFPGHEGVEFKESELGLIPEGWGVGRLGDVLEKHSNKTSSGDHLSDRAYVPIDCIAKKTLALSEVKSWQEAQSSLVLFEENDILFGAMRPYFHKVAIAPLSGVTRSTCFVLRPRKPNSWAFSALTAFREDVVDHAAAHSKGATIPYAAWEGSLEDFPIVIPPDELLKRYDELASPFLSWIKKQYNRQKNLRVQRDLLLPKLISGEIDVSDIPMPT
ncbi:MAG: restriction endonuclease subunit S [Pseudomonas sp.]|uniref:restriction endonuclease subunit S n=1 Tax=Pseudomonas sp. TaxID=306 RepID=UPI003D0E9A54